MTAKKKQTVEATREWFFPTLGKTVSAVTYEEALTLATAGEEEREEGDASI